MNKIEKNFLYYFPITIIFFSPSKYLLDYISLPDLFTYVHLAFFIIYISLKGAVIINKNVVLFVFLFIFSFLGYLINNLIDSPTTFKYQIRWLNYFLAFWMAINYVKEANLNYLIRGLFSATWIVCIYGIIQTLFIEDMINTIFWVNNFPSYILITFRTISTFANPLNLCVFLAFPLGVLQFRSVKTSGEKMLMILIYITFIFTASKMALLLIIISTLVYFRKYIKTIIYIFSFLGIISVIIGLNKNLQQILTSQFWIVERINNTELLKGSIDQRIYVLNSSLKMIRDNPLFGIGYDNFKSVYLDGYKNINASELETSFTSENFILDFYLDNGLIPVLIMLLFFIQALVIFVKSQRQDLKQISFPLLLFFCCGLILSTRTVPLLFMFFIFLATLFKLSSIYKYEGKSSI